MNPTSNQTSNQPDSCWGYVKRTVFQNPRYETVSQIFQGALLGAWTTTILSPGLYAVNMTMLKKKPVLKDSFRGVSLNVANVVPQISVQITVYKLLKEYLLSNKRDTDFSFQDNLLCSGIAGGTSGAVTASGETAVLNYQKQKVITHTIKQIVAKTYQAGGITRCNIGAGALAVREMIWATSYLTLTPTISDLYCSSITNQHVCDVFGAATAGGIAGFLTNPANYLRAQKQNEALSQKPRTYLQITKDAGVKQLFQGVRQRMLVTAVACVIITESKKVMNSFLRT